MKDYKNIYKGKRGLAKLLKTHYLKKINGKVIVNTQTGFKIKLAFFGKKKGGGEKSIFGGKEQNDFINSKLTTEKAVVIHHLPQILKTATLKNVGKPKGDKPQHKDVIMFLYFVEKIQIDSKIKEYQFDVRLFRGGKGIFHYSIQELLQ